MIELTPMKKFIYILLAVLIVATGATFWIYRDTYLYGLQKVSNYAECVKAGGMVLTSRTTNNCLYGGKGFVNTNTTTNTAINNSSKPDEFSYELRYVGETKHLK